MFTPPVMVQPAVLGGNVGKRSAVFIGDAIVCCIGGFESSLREEALLSVTSSYPHLP